LWDQAERKSAAIGSNMETHESCENNIGNVGQSIWDQIKDNILKKLGIQLSNAVIKV
jgi:hypothetical protein